MVEPAPSPPVLVVCSDQDEQGLSTLLSILRLHYPERQMFQRVTNPSRLVHMDRSREVVLVKNPDPEGLISELTRVGLLIESMGFKVNRINLEGQRQ